MLTDARALNSGSSLRADVCIVGGGAAGITIAMEMLNSDLSVLLLESGGTESDAATQALAQGESIGAPLTSLDNPVNLDQTRLRYLGGTTNHWAGFCRPLSPIDFETRDHLVVSGWPIDYADMVPYWDRAAEWVRISDADFSIGAWERRLGVSAPPIDTLAVEPLAFQVSFPTKFGDVYAPELRAAANIEVLLHANALNLAGNDGQRVAHVDVATLSGVSFTVEARAYVLAAGGIENARLLLASIDSDPAGLGNSNGLVGRYFSEHLQIYAGFGVLEPDFGEVSGLQGGEVAITQGRHAGHVHGAKFALGLTDAHLRSAATTGLELQFLPGRLPDGAPLQEQGVTVGDISAMMAHTGPEPGTAVYLQALAEQEPNPQSRVMLGSRTDALGMRRVRLDWQYTAADRRRVIAGLRVMAEAIGAADWGRLQLVPGGVHADAHGNLVSGELLTIFRSVPDEIDLSGFPVGVGFHHMCTTRMSRSVEQGVVDADCRMHEVDNLWVAGSSVFATAGTATPTMSIVALSIRLADHLQELLG
ncbi:MAG: GMC family oxidoreductase [Acidimicrobiaceae bacterium]|nr:GMC family oxidoreductase [Acidimicrobiaceae bacterium]